MTEIMLITKIVRAIEGKDYSLGRLKK